MLKVLHIFSKPENINARYANALNEEMTPLMLACQNEHLEVVEFLLSSFDDIDVNATTSYGWPTLWLCMLGVCAPETIKLMLAMSNQRNLGLDINAKGLDGSTILFIGGIHGKDCGKFGPNEDIQTLKNQVRLSFTA